MAQTIGPREQALRAQREDRYRRSTELKRPQKPAGATKLKRLPKGPKVSRPA